MRSAAFALLTLACTFGHALASGGPDLDNAAGFYTPVGIGSGVSVDDEGHVRSFFSGEASAAYFNGDDGLWFGAYSDWSYLDGGQQRISLGPELGILYGGIDGGYVAKFDGVDRYDGATLRAIFQVVTFAFYLRRDAFFGKTQDNTEAGLLFKFPVRWTGGEQMMP